MFGQRISWPANERDASGLTDRAYLDVLGRCVSAAIVVWLSVELVLAASGTLLAPAAALVALATLLYLGEWFGELLRQSVIYADTWRYGVSA